MKNGLLNLVIAMVFVACLFAQDDPAGLISKANAGDPAAQVQVGNMYAFGTGVGRNSTEAAKWFRIAADQGDAQAQFSLGDLYDEGQGVPQDFGEALRWYRMAAGQGYGPALCNIGILYFNAQGVPRNLAQSYSWISNCEKAGDPRAAG